MRVEMSMTDDISTAPPQTVLRSGRWAESVWSVELFERVQPIREERDQEKFVICPLPGFDTVIAYEIYAVENRELL